MPENTPESGTTVPTPPTPDQQAKANADAAFAVGALCGALGGVGREVLATKVQHRFEEVIAEQDRPLTALPPKYEPAQDYDDTFHVTEIAGGRTVAVCPTWEDCTRVSTALNTLAAVQR